MFWKTEKPKPKRPKPAPVKREPTPAELVLDVVTSGEVLSHYGQSYGISKLSVRGQGMDVYTEVFSSGAIHELRVGKAGTGRFTEARRQVSFGKASDDKIAAAATRRVRAMADEEVRKATKDFFEGMGNG